MKWIDELSEQEILALTDEDVFAMVRYQCAVQGIRIVEAPEEPKRVNMEPALKFYEVERYLFENQADAEEAVRVISKSWQAGWGEFKTPRERTRDLDINVTMLYSQKQLDQHKDEMESYQRSKSVYDNLKEEYDEAEGKRRELLDQVWEKVNEVQERFGKLNRLRDQFAEYVKVAKGDRNLAWQFFVKAYGEQDASDKNYITNTPSEG